MKTKIIKIAIVICFLLLSTFIATAEDGSLIIVVKSRNIEPYNQALTGFKQALRAQGTSNIKVIEYDLKGKKEESQRIVEEIRAKRPALVLAIGSLSASVVSEQIKNIPIVFSMIVNPVGNGLVQNLKSSGNNLTGVSMDIPIKVQFEYLKKLMPEMKSIGVLYNPGQTQKTINEAAAAAGRLNLNLVAKTVTSEKEVPKVLEELAGEVDVLWAIVDNTVYTSQSAKFILLFTLRNKLPFMAFSVNYVEAGALIGLHCDYQDMGRQSAEKVLAILNGKSPGDVPISPPRKVEMAINLRVAKVIGVKIPDSIINKADKIFD